jgi:hypothetical protein
MSNVMVTHFYYTKMTHNIIFLYTILVCVSFLSNKSVFLYNITPLDSLLFNTINLVYSLAIYLFSSKIKVGLGEILNNALMVII